MNERYYVVAATIGTLALVPYFQAAGTDALEAEIIQGRIKADARTAQVIPFRRTTRGEVVSTSLSNVYYSLAPVSLSTRRLTAAEDRMFYRALMRSSKIISKGKFLSK